MDDRGNSREFINPSIRAGKSKINFIQCSTRIFKPMTSFLADATNEQIGVFIFAGAVVTGFIATLISVASYFATRREVEDLKARVDKIEADLDDKTAKIHKRVNRLLAGQMLIAGRVGCSLDQHQDQITAWMAELDREED
jgi:hypothetical protein